MDAPGTIACCATPLISIFSSHDQPTSQPGSQRAIISVKRSIYRIVQSVFWGVDPICQHKAIKSPTSLLLSVPLGSPPASHKLWGCCGKDSTDRRASQRFGYQKAAILWDHRARETVRFDDDVLYLSLFYPGDDILFPLGRMRRSCWFFLDPVGAIAHSLVSMRPGASHYYLSRMICRKVEVSLYHRRLEMPVVAKAVWNWTPVSYECHDP